MIKDHVSIFFADGVELLGLATPSDESPGQWDYFFTPEAWSRVKGVPTKFRFEVMTPFHLEMFKSRLRGRAPVLTVFAGPPAADCN